MTTFNSIGWPHGLNGPSSWQLLQTWAPDRFVIGPAPESHGLGNIAHVTVKPGDKVGGWTGERSEVAVLLDAKGQPISEEAAVGTVQFYAKSVFVPVGWQSPQPDPSGSGTWGCVLQLHGPDDWAASPPIALSLTDRFALTLNGGNIDKLGGFHVKTYPFSDASLNAGAWTDFVIEIGFAVDNSGHVKVSRRNTPSAPWSVVADVEGVPTLMSSAKAAVGHHYWKQGFYRSASPKVTNELYLTGLVRAPSFVEAAAAAFGG